MADLPAVQRTRPVAHCAGTLQTALGRAQLDQGGIGP
jgi:hypothetical protein